VDGEPERFKMKDRISDKQNAVFHLWMTLAAVFRLEITAVGLRFSIKWHFALLCIFLRASARYIFLNLKNLFLPRQKWKQ